MKTKLNLENWPRKDHFTLFNQFDEPFFSVNVDLDCTLSYRTAKEMGVSFYLYYLYCTLQAVNGSENFRYRVEDNEIFIYERIDVSHTVIRPDGTFGFGYVPYTPTLTDFITLAEKDRERILNSTGLDLDIPNENIIHFSALPGIRFTGLTHARSFSYKDSTPKISVGKVTEANGVRTMPVSITVHHGLMDGLHVAQFIDLFQEMLNKL
jgi:chloramphenicol O-acetyltransferase type A